MKRKILIIKIGYSETLGSDISLVTSYGDVLRTTVLLNLYKDDYVTWLVDEKSYPILKNNKHISRFMIYGLTSVLQLQSEYFDVVINLEKVLGLCALADRINARQHCGFRFNPQAALTEAHDNTQNVLSICKDNEKKKNHHRHWRDHLFEMVGSKWQGEDYLFGYSPKTKEKFDIGFNYTVGNKWPTKAWPLHYWKELEKLLKKDFIVSWQKGLDNLEHYFDWINSCRLIISNDSFGLHLGIALKKKLIGIFGPTNPRETYLYGRDIALAPNTDCPYIPHYSKDCKNSEQCLPTIKPERVYSEVCKLLKK